MLEAGKEYVSNMWSTGQDVSLFDETGQKLEGRRWGPEDTLYSQRLLEENYKKIPAMLSEVPDQHPIAQKYMQEMQELANKHREMPESKRYKPAVKAAAKAVAKVVAKAAAKAVVKVVAKAAAKGVAKAAASSASYTYETDSEEEETKAE